MITALALNHPRLRLRIELAMLHAKAASRANGVGLQHASGIDVVHINGKGFQFFDMRDNNITETVIDALNGRVNFGEIAA